MTLKSSALNLLSKNFQMRSKGRIHSLKATSSTKGVKVAITVPPVRRVRTVFNVFSCHHLKPFLCEGEIRFSFADFQFVVVMGDSGPYFTNS